MPGSDFTSTISPKRSTMACWRSLTTKIDDQIRNRTMAAATARKGRRFAMSVASLAGLLGGAQLGQRQIGDHPLPAALLDDHLVGTLQHVLHGLQEQALARHVGRLGVFVVDGDE